ncbi:hypothetical protein [uncultured Shewanella sp.]|uniref:hypothetical protein n=1 Tax=uncultured Shewanella sp. TaxID=173975 RepID=UPI0026087268|nr:hypothetical protein [uncultured Shewanella sp.]
MDTLTNITTTSNQLTNGSFTNEKAVSSLVPVNLQMSKSGLSVNLSGQVYTLKTPPQLSLQSLKQAQHFVLNIVQINGAITQSTLLALGQAHSIPLPQALLSAVSHNKLQERKLHQLANRSSGYPLPTAKIKHEELVFNTGFSIKLEILHLIKQGEYSASIKSKNNQLFLELNPIQLKAEVNLISALGTNKPLADKVNSEASEASSQKLTQKTDVNFQYRQLFKSLESITTENLSLKKEELNHNDCEEDAAPLRPVTPSHLLAGALEKAGGLPRSASAMPQAKETLATALLRFLPMLSPETLIELSQPQRLKQTIIGTLSHSPSPNDWLSTPLNNHINTISLLFQLLLGRASASQITPELALKLSMLQEHLGLPEPLVKLVESSACHSSISKLLSNLSLYQHASSKNDQMINYYFAVPYSINHYQEQLEGHVQKDNSSSSDKNDIWRLQLKFNLASGPLLINAQVLKQVKSQASSSLKLNFLSRNETVISKIDLLKPALAKKLEDIGFRQVTVNTKKDSVPATILPGEHYLVKLNV